MCLVVSVYIYLAFFDLFSPLQSLKCCKYVLNKYWSHDFFCPEQGCLTLQYLNKKIYVYSNCLSEYGDYLSACVLLLLFSLTI